MPSASSPGQISRLVSDAKRKRQNRVYYTKSFQISDIHQSGIVQSSSEKNQYDSVALADFRNESLQMLGFDQSGSNFSLTLTVVSLFPDIQIVEKESRWRLKSVNLSVYDAPNKCRYSYIQEQLVDYEAKRISASFGGTCNVYRIGSMSIETVVPFALCRVLFNGLANRFDEQTQTSQLVALKLTISTHPASDKFDYKNRFNSSHLSKIIHQSSGDSTSPEELLDLALEDRIDQTMMYQFQMERLDGKLAGRTRRLTFFGTKIRRFMEARDQLNSMLESKSSQSREDMFAWAECGHQVNLTRPSKHPSLVYGSVSSSVDYASHLYGAQYQESSDSGDQLSDFGRLADLSAPNPGSKIMVRAYKKRDYKIVIGEQVATINTASNRTDGSIEAKILKISINDFDGYCLVQRSDFSHHFRSAQRHLWSVAIGSRAAGFERQLASERLLGGKGNSLLELSDLLGEGKGPSELLVGRLESVTVPEGLVVTCVAYRTWLASSSRISNALRELEITRRTLAARSVFTNPFEKTPNKATVSVGQQQQILKEQCKKTYLELSSCPLPESLELHLFSRLKELFGAEALREPPPSEPKAEGQPLPVTVKFACRSSAVGEDSLETSAAGQMRTVLGVTGFRSICRAVVECWASQFELEAVTYKSQNGLPLNLPMAVVVQRLIEGHSAGVAATCDPLTGSRQQIEILANRGLGEAVVAGQTADTIRLSIPNLLCWDSKKEHFAGNLNIELHDRRAAIEAELTKIPGNPQTGSEVCLNEAQIAALCNVIVWLTRKSSIKERELEWCITLSSSPDSSSSSSSSSGSSDLPNETFRVHLLQSRPLTNLARPSNFELDHELDYGHSGPEELLTRANLGEVMPGALCPLNLSYFFPVSSAGGDRGKPFEKNHTRAAYVSHGMGLFARVATLVLTYADSISRLPQSSDDPRSAIFSAMIGYETKMKSINPRIEQLVAEKINPIAQLKRKVVLEVVALDMGGVTVNMGRAKHQLNTIKLHEDLEPISELLSRLAERPEVGVPINSGRFQADHLVGLEHIYEDIRTDIQRLYNRICKRLQPLKNSWIAHIQSTMTNIFVNLVCSSILSGQEAYKDKSMDLMLQDFGSLIKGRTKTESGAVAALLDKLVGEISNEGQLDEARQMSHEQLYELLTSGQGNKKCAEHYAKFITKNGHRSFKEFDLASLSWADDPSYIIKSLAIRLKHSKVASTESNKHPLPASANSKSSPDEKVAASADQVLQRVTRGRLFLSYCVLPRVINAVQRREKSKSVLIRSIDKYRHAFRHLGGLLCLMGCLPSADLIFYLSMDEIDQIVSVALSDCRSHRADLSRFLFKARRRKQRQPILNTITYPVPTMCFRDVIAMVQETLGEQHEPSDKPEVSNEKHSDESSDTRRRLVRGLISCSGKVTGRACVVKNIDDMEAIQPQDILITYSIDISWSVYFFTLAGIVTEVGGIISHGAVVAREYGIPTLCTAIGACSKFETGQLVTLDANEGVCYLADDQSAAIEQEPSS